MRVGQRGLTVEEHEKIIDALRDALRGVDDRTLTELYTRLHDVLGAVQITDGVETAEVTDEGYLEVSTHSDHGAFTVAFEKDAINATIGFVLIDLSDAAHYPHTLTGYLGVDFIIITGLGDANAEGYYDIGFITRIDGTDADWFSVFHGHFDKKEERFEIILTFAPMTVCLRTEQSLSGGGMKLDNDATFQTDVAVEGTYGNPFPAVGDLVLKVTRTAGQADLAVLVGYHTHE